MAIRTNLTLISYDATSRQKAFVVQYGPNGSKKTATYFGNVERYDDVFDKTINANRFCLSADIGTLHNIYDSSRILFHGLAARRHRYQYTTKDDYQHIYRAIAAEDLSTYLNNGLCSITKAQDTLYGIDSPGKYGHYYVNDDMYSWLAQDNGYPIPKPMTYTTLLYNEEHLSAANTPKIVDSLISGITYNTLFEIPGNLYTDYSSGSMFATTVKCKNHLNAKYSMASDLESHIILTNTRYYNGISACNNQVYLSFSDRGSFLDKQRDISVPVKISETETHTITHKYAEPRSQLVAATAKVEQIELIENINRGATPSNHKSSLYSLRLFAPDLETPTQTDISEETKQSIKENIRQEIKNVIRSLAERIAPANAQLFTVTVNGK